MRFTLATFLNIIMFHYIMKVIKIEKKKILLKRLVLLKKYLLNFAGSLDLK